jgi:hypothetical protein
MTRFLSKSLDLESSNYSALYGIAYCYREIERKKSKTLFHQYLEMVLTRFFLIIENWSRKLRKKHSSSDDVI